MTMIPTHQLVIRVLLLFILQPSLTTQAKEMKAGKSKYSLFKPTPIREMRAFSPDRPSKTEGPYTVDAGHVQLEIDLVNFTHDTSSDNGSSVTTTSTNLATTNFRIGLTNSVDLHVIFSPFVNQYTVARMSPADSRSGFGDTILRLKINFLGNDGGDVATGVLPYMKFPTSTGNTGNTSVEGGVILPLAINVPYEWALGFMVNWGFAKNEADNDMHNEIEVTACAAHDIIGKLNGYVEIASERSSEPDTEWAATFDAGLTYGLTENFSWDLGANFGLTKAADDFNPFMGVSARF
jgi:hypothetical protein